MYILDTNVVSEIMRDQPTPHVLKWVDSQPNSSIFATSITEAEIFAGIAVLPAGQRRRHLSSAADRVFSSLFSTRILSFDRAAAFEFAIVSAMRRSAGVPIGYADCQIAAIARSNGSSVATRNVSDFIGCGVEVVNPWTSS